MAETGRDGDGPTGRRVVEPGELAVVPPGAEEVVGGAHRVEGGLDGGDGDGPGLGAQRDPERGAHEDRLPLDPLGGRDRLEGRDGDEDGGEEGSEDQ